MIGDGLIIVAPKVVTDFSETHNAQTLGYLTITGLRIDLLVSFKYADLRWKRVDF